jgi:hypothetical protein
VRWTPTIFADSAQTHATRKSRMFGYGVHQGVGDLQRLERGDLGPEHRYHGEHGDHVDRSDVLRVSLGHLLRHQVVSEARATLLPSLAGSSKGT